MEMTSLDTVSQQDFDREAQEAFSTLAAHLNHHGVSVKPWDSANLRHFGKMEVNAQVKVIADIRELNQQMAIHADRDLWTIENQILWRLMHQFKFRFPNELFEELPKDAIVELYTADNTQIFRSLKFFKICSYTLEDVYCRPWFELYEKNEAVMKQSFEILSNVASGMVRGVIRKPFDTHLVAEKGDGKRLVNKIEPIMLCFFEDAEGRPTGFLNAFRSMECTTLRN